VRDLSHRTVVAHVNVEPESCQQCVLLSLAIGTTRHGSHSPVRVEVHGHGRVALNDTVGLGEVLLGKGLCGEKDQPSALLIDVIERYGKHPESGKTRSSEAGEEDREGGAV